MPSNEIKTDSVIGLMADVIKELSGTDVCSEFIAKSIRLDEITVASLAKDYETTIGKVVSDIETELMLNFGQQIHAAAQKEGTSLKELAEMMAEFANSQPKKAPA